MVGGQIESVSRTLHGAAAATPYNLSLFLYVFIVYHSISQSNLLSFSYNINLKPAKYIAVYHRSTENSVEEGPSS